MKKIAFIQTICLLAYAGTAQAETAIIHDGTGNLPGKQLSVALLSTKNAYIDFDEFFTLNLATPDVRAYLSCISLECPYK